MSVTSSLKKQVDLPVWEWCRFAPVVSAAGLTLCSDESLGGRYIYYIGTACYRYDTWSDGWMLIATPNIALTSIGATRYTVFGGYRGKVIAATSNTITLPGTQAQKLLNYKIRISDGKGAGQQRTITYVSGVTIQDNGVVTASSGGTYLTDAQTSPYQKKWKVNQWSGYQCRVVYTTGQTQMRKILYNDNTGLTFNDVTWQAYDSWNNTAFSAQAPYAVPAAGSLYYIESSTATIDSAWTTIPDQTSRFVVLSGGVWFLTQKTLATGAAAMQYYDILTDTWFTKTCPGYLWPTLAQNDVTLERSGEISGIFYSGTCSTGDTRSFTDSAATWTYDRYANYQVRLTNPATGVIQRRRILSNNNNRMWIAKPWDAGFFSISGWTYSIYGDTNSQWVAGNSLGSMYKYLVEEDLWTAGQEYDTGIARSTAYAKTGQSYSFYATAVVCNTGVTSILTTPSSNSGTGYRVGDISYIGGNSGLTSGAKVRITNVDPYSGVVKGVELWGLGTGGTSQIGSSKPTITLIGGGSNLTVDVQSVGPVGYFTTVMPHDFQKGDVIWGSGATVAAWNFSGDTVGSYVWVDSVTNFYTLAPNYTAPAASIAQATTALVDASKSWSTNEHVGKAVVIQEFGPVPTRHQIRKITGSTATTLFFIAVPTALPTVGTSRYVICDLNSIGRDLQFRNTTWEGQTSWAFSGTSTTLTDTGITWVPAQWKNYTMRVISGTGFDAGEVAISSNTQTDLYFTGTTFIPDNTTKYRILSCWGTAGSGGTNTTINDWNKFWIVNQWLGKQVRIYYGAGANPVYETNITANALNQITYTSIGNSSDTNTIYTILGNAPRNTTSGIQLMWNYGQSDTTQAGKWIYLPRGGSGVAAGTNVMDRYDVNYDIWDSTVFQNPATEIETQGAQWSYDGKNGIYWTPSGAQGTRVFYLNLNTLTVDPAGIHPYANGAAVQGNRMEIITTVDGLMYLYILRVTGAEFFRTLLWWNS